MTGDLNVNPVPPSTGLSWTPNCPYFSGLRSDPTHSLQARKSSRDKSGYVHPYVAPTLQIEGLFNV
jgi:hypothetical protein